MFWFWLMLLNLGCELVSTEAALSLKIFWLLNCSRTGCCATELVWRSSLLERLNDDGGSLVGAGLVGGSLVGGVMSGKIALLLSGLELVFWTWTSVGWNLLLVWVRNLLGSAGWDWNLCLGVVWSLWGKEAGAEVVVKAVWNLSTELCVVEATLAGTGEGAGTAEFTWNLAGIVFLAPNWLLWMRLSSNAVKPLELDWVLFKQRPIKIKWIMTNTSNERMN